MYSFIPGIHSSEAYKCRGLASNIMVDFFKEANRNHRFKCIACFQLEQVRNNSSDHISRCKRKIIFIQVSIQSKTMVDALGFEYLRECVQYDPFVIELLYSSSFMTEQFTHTDIKQLLLF